MGKIKEEKKNDSEQRRRLLQWSRGVGGGLNTIIFSRPSSIQVEILLNKKVIMGVNTGASCSVMSLKKFQELGTLEDLKESSIKLRTYTGVVVKPHGVTEVDTMYEGTESVAIIDSER